MRSAFSSLLLGLGLMGWAFGVKPALAAPLTAEELEDLVRTARITSVDQLLEYLPAELRKNFSLMRSTRNLVQGASPNTPRIVLFSDDGKFMMAVAGSADMLGGQTVEMFTQGKDGQYTAARGQFQNGRFSIDHQPTSCRNCHGHPLRPIWDGYPNWVGAYGSHHDLMRPHDPMQDRRQNNEHYRNHSQEARDLKAFQEKAAREGRYRQLIGLARADYHALAVNNGRLAKAALDGTHRQILGRLMAQPDFGRALPGLIEMLNRSGFEYFLQGDEIRGFPDELLPKVRENYVRLRDVRMQELRQQMAQMIERRNALDPELFARFQPTGLKIENFATIDQSAYTLLEAVGDTLGVEPEFWRPSRLQGTIRQSGPGLISYVDFFGELVEELVRRDPAFARFVESHRSDAGLPYYTLRPGAQAWLAERNLFPRPGVSTPLRGFSSEKCRNHFRKLWDRLVRRRPEKPQTPRPFF